jgi:multiple antibiotic resistance protein
LIESAFLLFLVVDPFGNLPFVLAVTAEVPWRKYSQIIVRETILAFIVLVLFAIAGDQILGYLNVEKASLAVSGGVILFLISLKMIFRSAREIFDDQYDNDPFLVPLAVPSLAGPSAITTVMILRSQQHIDLANLLFSLLIVFSIACIIFLLGRRLSVYLGNKGIYAMEKLMGLLLNLIAINMILAGTKDFLSV